MAEVYRMGIVIKKYFLKSFFKRIAIPINPELTIIRLIK